MLGFEEPHGALLTASAVLLLAAPLGMLMHLAVTPELTATEKRNWLHALGSRKGLRVLAAYFRSGERARVTRELTDAQPSQ